ncbi:hypothetical protein NQZ79_g533 [Umbelopsis isabellina]|nr:hypothetical protein NQZ79_g533 [Umbelopsis isabellina]
MVKHPRNITLSYLRKQHINVFRVPEELLAIMVRHDDNVPNIVPPVEESPRLIDRSVDSEGNPVLTCSKCGIQFEGSEKERQRSHFRSDWHRYNVKRSLEHPNLPPVTEQQFQDMLEDLTESISGSDTDESASDNESDGPADDNVNMLISKEKLRMAALERAKLKAEQKQKVHLHNNSPLSWYTAAPTLPENVHLGVYNCVRRNVNAPLSADQLPAGYTRTWTMIMVGGGHFAAAVIDVGKSQAQENNSSRATSVIAHKTFHRYTTRRKQGGSQQANDNAHGTASSAGSQIRRYNEVALQQEIRELLSQWRKYLQESDTIFIHAPSANRKIIYGYEDAPLDSNDPRIHSFPFTTHRPTLNEIKRAFFELTDLKLFEIDDATLRRHEQDLARAEEARLQAISKFEELSMAPPSDLEKTAEPDAPKPDADIEKAILLTKQGKVHVLKSFIERCTQQGKNLPIGDILPPTTKIEDSKRLATLLHVASNYNQPEMVNYLLRECNADPTIPNEGGKVPYDLTKEKAVRNVFRRCMSDMPEKWEWLKGAKVPSPLTAEMEKQQLEKEEQKRQKELETRRKIEEQKRKKEERKLANAPAEEPSVKASKASPLQGLYGGNAMNTASMSPEARMRLEREVRARAAEARRAKVMSEKQ